jgi:hypothetical protein
MLKISRWETGTENTVQIVHTGRKNKTRKNVFSYQLCLYEYLCVI